jgi:hypothetical protein
LLEIFIIFICTVKALHIRVICKVLTIWGVHGLRFAKTRDEMKSQDENNTHEKDRTKLVFSVKVGLTGLSPSVLHCCSLSSLNQAFSK